MLAGEVPRPTSLLDCNGCGTCEIMCPDLAVTVQEVICDAATVDAR